MVGHEATLVENSLGQFGQGPVQGIVGHGVDPLEKAPDRFTGPGGQSPLFQDLNCRLPHRHCSRPGMLPDHLQGTRPDSPGRQVDHALERGIGIPVAHQPHVGQGVLDFRPLEKPQPAVDTVGGGGRQQQFLKHPGLCVGAVQDGHAVPPVAFPDPGFDGVDHEPGLVDLVAGAVEPDRVALAGLGPEILAHAAGVVGDHRVGGGEDVAAGTVVLLQADDPGAGKVLLEGQHVLDPGSAPAVDRLVVIPNGEQVLARIGKQPEPLVLDGVGVLELVHQHMPEPALPGFADGLVVPEQFQCPQQDFGEIHQPQALAGFLVGGIDAQQGLLVEIGALRHMPGAPRLVLVPVDVPLQLPGHPAGLVQVQVRQYPAHDAKLVLAVDDLEGLRQPGLLPVHPEQAVAESVEGAHPHAAAGELQQLLDAPAHFPGCLVGEGDREYVEWR